MKNASELLEEAVYAGNLSENEEKRLYSWIESLILAKRKSDEYEAKAKAFDESLRGFKELERLHEEVRKVSKRNQAKSEVYKETLSHVIREMESALGESGEYDAKK